MLQLRRLAQVLHYGKIHARQIADNDNLNWIPIYFDILWCYKKYKMWSNQYLKEKFWKLTHEERKKRGGGIQSCGDNSR